MLCSVLARFGTRQQNDRENGRFQAKKDGRKKDEKRKDGKKRRKEKGPGDHAIPIGKEVWIGKEGLTNDNTRAWTLPP